MKSRVVVITTLFLAVALSACAGRPQPVVTQTIATEAPSATAIPAQVIETSTATQTATTEPTKAAPTSTPRPSPTPFPIVTEARNGTEVMLQVHTWSLPSPDGKWIAQGTEKYPTTGGEYFRGLKVVSQDGIVEWILVDKWEEWLLGYPLPRPLRWSPDSRYFYFTTMFVPDGCGLFINGSDVQQLDVTTGRLTELVPRVSSALSLSPDTTMLAYITEGPALVLRHLATGAEQQIRLDVPADSPAGSIVWSPDGNAIMLTTAVSPCGPPDWAQSVIRVDVTALSQTTILDDDKRLLQTVEWPEAEKVLLQDWNGNFWWLNPTTGELTPKEN